VLLIEIKILKNKERKKCEEIKERARAHSKDT
jgi:hypothetical protein